VIIFFYWNKTKMSEKPLIHETAGTEPQTYTIGLDPATVDIMTKDLSSSERVRFWSTFESTVDIPHPSIATGRMVDDVSAVFAGSKPAVIIFPEDLDDPLVKELFSEERDQYKSLAKRGARDYYGGQRYFLGKEENVKDLSELYFERGGDDSPRPADESFHRAVGSALGYSPEAINNFVAQISRSKE
jgi:hypothetical protein